MIAGAAFDIYAGQFTAGEVAQICGVSKPVIEMWGSRGFIEPTRRERPKPLALRAKGSRSIPTKGRPLFSARNAFKARLMRVLAVQLELALSPSMEVASKAEKRKVTKSDLPGDSALGDAAFLAEEIAMGGEWMWGLARSYERGAPLNIYAYATRSGAEWLFDMHIGENGKIPSFGWKVAHVRVPIAEIFIAVYVECKKMLGLMDKPLKTEEA